MRAFFKQHGTDILDFTSKGWVQLVVFGVVTIVTVWAKMFESLEMKSSVPLPIADIFTSHPSTRFIADYLPLFTLALTLFLSWIKDQIDSDRPDPFTLLSLIDSLALAVGKKTSSRHHKACLVTGHRDVSNFPIHISTPREQIKTLVDGVYKVFQREALERKMPKELQIKVTLARMDDRRLFHEFWYYFPTDLAPTSTDAFRGNKTGFSVTVEKGEVFILEDIKKELQKERGEQRYFASKSEAGNNGSIICLPISIEPITGHPTVPFVLTIKCDTPNTFCEARKRRYNILAKPFVDRIRLEYYNHIINQGDEHYVNHNNPQAGGKNVSGIEEGSGRTKTTGRATVQSTESDGGEEA